MENVDEWAKKIIDTHKNPLKNLDTIGQKFFVPKNSEEESTLFNKYLDILENALNTERVEKRSARAVGYWLPEKRLVCVTKVNGIINLYGFANKSGKYLNPEEAMFLMETNRLEILWNNVPMSIQQGYEVLVSDFEKYVQFRTFSLQGYRLKLDKKDETGESSSKKARVEPPHDCDNEMLKNLQALGPKTFKTDEVKQDFHYNVFVPDHASGSNEGLKFYSSKDSEIPSDIALMDGKTVIGSGKSFYHFCPVKLPDLT
ncbi:hypothetical protein FQR65_LT01516 [Abscondita terminalis]|nr:hypothetical protein FQR65_LT01516 [Abscondita terminalis]